jgi:hypothetical protein
LAIGAALALSTAAADAADWRKKAILAALLAVGAVTPIQEFARALARPSWPINLQATLIEAWCGRYPAHYVAGLKDQAALRILRPPHPLPPESRQGQPCSGLRT